VSCSSPIAFETLVAWWLAELAQAEQEALEEHVFACAHCTRRLEELAALAGGVRNAVRAGAVGMVVSAPFVEGMKKAGLRVREYHLTPGSSVNCTIYADDDATVGRMRAPLRGVQRLDVLEQVVVGGVPRPEVRLEDVPFDPAADEVLLLPSAAALKKMPSNTLRVRLVSVKAAGETAIGEYVFAHTAQ
jgi:hypothetical protein